MAFNEPSLYGHDIIALLDADELMTEGTGLIILEQDLLHRITADDVPGTDSTSDPDRAIIVGWGRDARKLLGRPVGEVAKAAPSFAEVLMRDDRVQTAGVVLTAIEGPPGTTADVRMDIDAETALGPFRKTLLVSQLTPALLVEAPP